MKALPRPKAIIFDLDDTLIISDATVRQAWNEACERYARKHPPLDPETIFQAIREVAIWFWSDPTRHREGRNNMGRTRRELVLKAFENLEIDDPEGALGMADWFSERRYEMIELFPGALETLKDVRKAGLGLGLLTNGEALMQRRKIDQFQLASYFDVIQIEGEKGIGKPEPEAYRMILESLQVAPEEAWIVGDNLEWEVIAPQSLGIRAIWQNYYKRQISDPSIKPDWILDDISQFSQVLELSLNNA